MPSPDPERRALIERALHDPLARIPAGLRPGFHAYQYEHFRRFLLIVNLLGQAAFLVYGLADWLVAPDVASESMAWRAAYVGLCLPLALACFHWVRDVRLLDLLLPVEILFAALLWFTILSRSGSPHLESYQHAAVIFIVLANLSIRVQFWPALAMSLLISGAIALGALRLAGTDRQELLVFALVYLPVLFFSLFISWSTTLERRRAYLHAQLDAMTRDALAAANARLQEMAHTDALTGLANRRRFEESGQREVVRAQRYGEPLSLLLFDVDHFKRINDTFGHEAGDRVLVELAAAARDQLREHDLVARWGGEEFAVLLPNTPLDGAALLAERLRMGLSALVVMLPEGVSLRLSVSIGVASLAGKDGRLDDLLRQADAALYRAKQEGRDRVRVAEPD